MQSKNPKWTSVGRLRWEQKEFLQAPSTMDKWYLCHIENSVYKWNNQRTWNGRISVTFFFFFFKRIKFEQYRIQLNYSSYLISRYSKRICWSQIVDGWIDAFDRPLFFKKITSRIINRTHECMYYVCVYLAPIYRSCYSFRFSIIIYWAQWECFMVRWMHAIHTVCLL